VIDGDEWTGLGLAPVAGAVRFQATPHRERGASTSPARGGSTFAAVVSLAIHAAIVVAAALSLGAPQPTGAPDAIAVELVASTGEAPTPAPEHESTRAAPAPHDDSTTPAQVGSNDTTPVATGAPATAALQAADALDAPTPTASPEATVAAAPNAGAIVIPTLPEAADASDVAPPAPPSPAPSPDATRAVVTPSAASAALQSAAAPPRIEPGPSAKPPTPARAASRIAPAARLTGARAAATAVPPAPALAHGAAELAAYRDALLAKIRSLARYPDAARERGPTGVATVRFALDGLGVVTLADLAQSSGDRALDDAAVAAVRRASPLPPPPAGASRAYSAPIRFELR
jgi:protein TonB